MSKKIDKNELSELERLNASLESYKNTLNEIYKQYDQKIEELSLVRRTGYDFRNALGLENLAKVLLENVSREIEVNFLTLLVTESNNKNFYLRACYQPDKETFQFFLPAKHHLYSLQKLGLNKEQDLSNPFFMPSKDSFKQYGDINNKSNLWLVMPLVVRGNLIGLLILSRDVFFTQEDERILAIIGDQAGAALANVMFFDDLSKVNQKLRDSEKNAKEVSNYLERLLESAHDVILTLNAAGEITYANQRISQWGWKKEDVIGCKLKAMLDDASQNNWPLDNKKAFLAWEALLINAHGEKRNILLSASKVDTGKTKIKQTSWMVLIGDHTEIKALEKQLIHSERLASIGLLAAGVAHEIGNPLSAISGYAQILLADEQSSKENREYLEAILSQSIRIEKILAGLRDYSRPAKGLIETIDLREALTKIIEMLKSQRIFQHIKFEFFSSNEPSYISIDRDHLSQIIVNIAVNSAQAMNNAGKISFSIHDSKDRVYITINDSGPGIPANIKDKIFDPFFTTKSPGEGTGLGLAICQRLMENYSGFISIDNASKQGAIFNLFWPKIKI